MGPLSKHTLKLAAQAEKKLKRDYSTGEASPEGVDWWFEDGDEEMKKALDAVRKQDRSCNFLTIRFEHEGTIVWSCPADQDAWDCPGKILFAVKMKDFDAIVPVTVPNFDLRYQHETSWYC